MNHTTQPHQYAAWSPDTGTHELPRIHRGTPVSDLSTTELPFWLSRPTVPTRHDRCPRLVRAARRLTRTAFAVNVGHGWRRSLAVMGVFGIGYFVLLIGRGAYVAAEMAGLTR